MAKRMTKLNEAFDEPQSEDEAPPRRKTMLDLSQEADLKWKILYLKIFESNCSANHKKLLSFFIILCKESKNLTEDMKNAKQDVDPAVVKDMNRLTKRMTKLQQEMEGDKISDDAFKVI